jgi:hypothetical protein
MIEKKDLNKMGWKLDIRYRLTRARTIILDKVKMARNFIYNGGYAIGSTAVENILKDSSSVPTVVS